MTLARELAACTVEYRPVRFIAEVARVRNGSPVARCHAGACHAVAGAFGPSGPLCWPCHEWMRLFMERLCR
jgi:hypothetical protein